MVALKNWGLSKGAILGLVGVAAVLTACDAQKPKEQAAPVPAPVVVEDAAPLASFKPEPSSALAAYLGGRLAHSDNQIEIAADYFLKALEYDPDNRGFILYAFGLSLSRGDVESAVKLAPKVIDAGGNVLLAGLVLGGDAVKRGDYQAAKAYFNALPKSDLTQAMKPFLLAWTELGDAPQDPQRLKKALELLASDMGRISTYNRALVYDLADQPDKAGPLYTAIAHDSLGIENIEAVISFLKRHGPQSLLDQLADTVTGNSSVTRLALDAMGDTPKRKVNTAQEGLAEFFFDMGMMLVQAKANDVALALLNLSRYLRPDSEITGLAIFEMLGEAERWQDAEKVLVSLENGPFRPYVLLRKAVLLERLERPNQALTTLDQALKSGAAPLEVLGVKGDLLARQKKYDEASKVYDEAISLIDEVQPRHWVLFYTRGITFERLKQWPKAEADFKKALELHPDQPDVLNYLGYSWVDTGQNLVEARAMIEKAVALRPRDGAITDSLGWALYRMGEYENAVEMLERAVELVPQDPTVNDHLGDAYYQVGRKAEALFQWKRALSFDPEPEFREIIETKIKTGTLSN